MGNKKKISFLCKMESLPDEVKINILLHLPRSTMGRLCRVNKEYQSLCRDDMLWKNLFHQHFLYIPTFLPTWYQRYYLMYRLQPFVQHLIRIYTDPSFPALKESIYEKNVTLLLLQFLEQHWESSISKDDIRKIVYELEALLVINPFEDDQGEYYVQQYEILAQLDDDVRQFLSQLGLI
jgi:hypothetical protein